MLVLLLKIISEMHDEPASYLGIRETFAALFVLKYWLKEFLYMQSKIALNLGVNKSNCCYYLTKSVLVVPPNFKSNITLGTRAYSVGNENRLRHPG